MKRTLNKSLFTASCLIGGVLSIAASPAYAQTSGAPQPYTYYSSPNAPQATAPQPASTAQPTAVGFFAPMAERIISDPLYLPLQEQVYGTSSYTYTLGSYDSYNHFGVKTTKTDTYLNSFAQSLAYGITDDVDIALSGSYLFGNSNLDNLRSGATSTSNSAGFIDPTLSLTYRYLDQRKNYPVDADLYIAYAPDMIQSRNAGGGNTGTEASGRQAATLRADVGREMQGLTLEGLAGATFNGHRDFVALGSNDTESASPYWQYFLAADSQVRLTDRFSLNGDVRWNLLDNNRLANNTTGLVWKTDNPNNVDFTVAMNYHILLNRLVAQLSYDNVLYTHTAYEYSVPSDNSEVKNQDNNVFGARLLYTFN